MALYAARTEVTWIGAGNSAWLNGHILECVQVEAQRQPRGRQGGPRLQPKGTSFHI